MGILDAPALSPAAAKKRYSRGNGSVAWLGDSLTANGARAGSGTGQYVGTVNTAAAAGATTITVDYPYTSANGFINPTPPGTDVAYVVEPGTPREEWVVPSAVSGAGPYTLTVPALTYAHAAGAPIRNEARAFDAVSVPMWTALLSKNRIRLGGIFAHGGYTTQQIKDIYLPQVLALNPKPWAVVLNVGTNDSYNLTTAMPTALSIIDAIIDAGILPVVTAAPPPGSAAPISGETMDRMRWNDVLSNHCYSRGIPFIDVNAALVNTASGGMKPTYSSDNTHPGPVGAKAWAQKIVDTLTTDAPRPIPLLFPQRNDTSDTNAYPFNPSNALLLNGSGGIPTGWSRSVALTGMTPALVTDPAVSGNLFQITRPANTPGEARYGADGVGMTPGHKYRVYLWIKTSGLDAAYNAEATTSNGITNSTFQGFSFRMMTSNELGNTMFSILNWTRDIPLSCISYDFTLAKDSAGSAMWWNLISYGGSSTPSYSVAVQPWLVDLTALGIG